MWKWNYFISDVDLVIEKGFDNKSMGVMVRVCVHIFELISLLLTLYVLISIDNEGINMEMYNFTDGWK